VILNVLVGDILINVLIKTSTLVGPSYIVVNLILINLNIMFEILPSASVLTEMVWSKIFVAHNQKQAFTNLNCRCKKTAIAPELLIYVNNCQMFRMT
jgi:hypothetical protein